MAENIFLIGFMGAGKSTIAKVLKEKLNVPLCEMDEMIVEQQKMAISDIFAQYGEAHFRDLETQLVKDISEKDGVIVSCGGGAVLREENVSFMKENGRIVLLSATPETIYERVKDSHNRPLLEMNMNPEYIGQLMEERKSRYEAAADIKIKTDGRTAAEICEEIKERLKFDVNEK